MFFQSTKDPYSLDWGNLTPEGHDADNQTVLHVFNVDISSTEMIERCIIFVTGKLIWSSKQIPANTQQKVTFDLRGQPITFVNRFRKMKEQILQLVKNNAGLTNITIEALL